MAGGTVRFQLKQVSNKIPFSDLIPHVHRAVLNARKATMDLTHFFRSVRLSHVSASARIHSLITHFWKTVHTWYNSYGFRVVPGLRENSLAKATDRFHLK